MNIGILRNSYPKSHPWSIGSSSALKQNQVKPVNILNDKHFSLFRNDNSIALIDDICPHRGAKLSMGRIKNNCIECPYHGWLYDENGELSYIPSHNNDNKPKRGDVKKYKLEENKFIWYFPDSTSIVEPPECKLLRDTKTWETIEGEEILEGNWMDWIMNGLDISHINYVHEFADEDNGVVNDMKILEVENGIQCTASVIPKPVNLLTKSIQVEASAINVEYIYPNTTCIRIKLKEPYEFITFTSITPINSEKTMMSWIFSYNFKIKDPMMQKYIKNELIKEMRKTIREDENIIKSIIPFDVLDVNVPCDRFQLACLQMMLDKIE
jgi:phenylpropionate dioxygenase-like ring-hydroxylating dioxygenase large terminal subunit